MSFITPASNILEGMSTAGPREKEKAAPRCLFTSSEVDLLTRNAGQLLEFHEQFVNELRAALTPLGFSGHAHEPDTDEVSEETSKKRVENIDAAIFITSAKFATEVSFSFPIPSRRNFNP